MQTTQEAAEHGGPVAGLHLNHNELAQLVSRWGGLGEHLDQCGPVDEQRGAGFDERLRDNDLMACREHWLRDLGAGMCIQVLYSHNMCMLRGTLFGFCLLRQNSLG